MSLDICLEQIQPTTVFSANYTHNVTDMWRKAGVYDALYRSEGCYARSVLPALRHGVRHMEDHPSDYRRLDSPNGWGTYDNALPWLRKLLVAFEEFPNAVIRVWK